LYNIEHTKQIFILYLLQDTDECNSAIPAASTFREKYFTHCDENRLTRKQKKAEAAKNKEIWFAKLNNVNVK